MLARIFINRPVLACVFSIVILLLGGIAAGLLPVAEYPEVTPPMVRVTAYYPGANAKVVADTVAAPIEQQVNGVEKMLYMTSQSNNDGSYTLDVTFEIGTNTNMAQVLVQNRVAIAEPSLPDVVRAIGVTTKKRAADILLAISLDSDVNPSTGKPYYDALYMSNFATIQLKDAISRIEGVGDVFVMGQQDYSMRIWLDPDKLASRNLTVTEVIKVLREQNVQVAAGQIGQPPASAGQDFQFTLSTLGRLVEPEQFARIVVNSDKNGETTYLRDVSRTTLGAKSEDLMSRLDRRPSSGLACYLLPGANALDTADAIKARMRELKPRFPAGLTYAIVYDTTPFVRESVNEVKNTLRDAIILVTIVILVFLQDWRSLLLPVIGVLVSLVGTFAVMMMMGFTLNNLTLFGLVLAIGIVVDDAIVVLENIERWMEKGLAAREATTKAMEEITGPIVAITLVLSSVLLPSTALSGLVGQFFRQFAVTISVSMLISALNAMTMTPALAVLFFSGRRPGKHAEDKEALPWWSFGLFGALLSVWLLTPIFGPALGLHVGEAHEEAAPGGMGAGLAEMGATLLLALPGVIGGGVAGWFFAGKVNWLLGFFFRGFNGVFDWVTRVYGRIVGWCLRFSAIVFVVYIGLVGLTVFGFGRIPTGFIPMQDKGYLVTNIQLPDSSSLERTLEVTDAVEKIALETPGVAHTLCLPGMSYVLNANSSNYSNVFIIFKPFHDRRDPELAGDAIAAKIRGRLMREIPEARVLVFGAPPISGLGTSAGFKLMVEAVGDVDYDDLQNRADELAAKGNQEPNLVGLFNGFRAKTPQLYVDIDREKVKSMGVALSDVFDTLQACVGSTYVNDFNRFGRTWQVNVQADTPFRMDAEKIKQLKVRNSDGDMVPLGAVAEVHDSSGPVQITRYNMFPTASINGLPRPGTSTGDAMATMETLSKSLPRNMGAEWTEVSFLQKQASKIEQFRDLRNNPVSAFVIGVVLVFFVLAGLYESWTLPWSVILVVPMCLLSALVGLMLAGYDVNIFVQVGFVVLVGLAAKNAILIVQFALDQEAAGATIHHAAEEAARERLRPILMTSFAFILGVFPLVIAEGAGHEMRRTLGMAVFAGMIGVTLFGLFLTPVFYAIVRTLVKRPTVAADAIKPLDPKAAGTESPAAHT